MHFAKLLVGMGLAIASYTSASPTPYPDHDDFYDRNLTARADGWPDHLYPHVRLHRFAGCRHNSTNIPNNRGIHIHSLQVDECFTPNQQLEDANMIPPSEKLINDLRCDELGDKAEDCKENPWNYLTEALYWQLPKVTKESLMKPVVRCNLTVFAEPDCKSDSKIVRFTNEAQDVCIPAHAGTSVKVDCYTQDQLDKYEEKGRGGPTSQWKESGILRYDTKDGKGVQKENLLPPIAKDGDKIEDKNSEEYMRTKKGRHDTRVELLAARLHRCKEDPMDDCVRVGGPGGY